MKILMINVVCGIRSTGRICTDLAAALEAQGHEVKIAYGRDAVPEPFQKYAVRIGTDADVKLHGLRARLTDGSGFGSRRATERFIEWVREWDPDVIHLHNIHGYYLHIAVLFDYLKTCRKRIIWTLHDCWAFTGHSAYCDLANCERWLEGCHDCPNRKEYPTSLTDHSRTNWAKKKALLEGIPDLTIITPSEWLAGLVRKSYLSSYPVRVIHNGIDTARFFPLRNDFREHFGLGDRFLLFGTVPAQDDGQVLSAYLKLAEGLADDCRLVLLGVTEEQKVGLPDTVLGLARTDSEKEAAYICSACDYRLALSDEENRQADTPETVADAVRKYREEPRARRERNANADGSGDGYWAVKEKLGLLGKAVVLGVAAIWDRRKGLEDVVAFSKAADARVVVVGVTEEQRRSLPDSILAYTATNNVEELRQLYAAADAFINLTYEDNFPTTNIEALACGTPVITYNTGGSPEAVVNGCGFVAEKGDWQTVVKNYRQCHASPQACVEASRRFTNTGMTAGYMNLYLQREDVTEKA